MVSLHSFVRTQTSVRPACDQFLKDDNSSNRKLNYDFKTKSNRKQRCGRLSQNICLRRIHTFLSVNLFVNYSQKQQQRWWVVSDLSYSMPSVTFYFFVRIFYFSIFAFFTSWSMFINTMVVLEPCPVHHIAQKQCYALPFHNHAKHS